MFTIHFEVNKQQMTTPPKTRMFSATNTSQPPETGGIKYQAINLFIEGPKWP